MTITKTTPSETVELSDSGELSRVPDMAEATRLADCEAFAMRERMAARSAEYFAKKDRESAR